MLDLSNKIRVGLAAVILIPVLLYWGFASSPNETERENVSLLHGMDYFVETAVIQEWDAEGKLLRTLHTDQLEHYPNLKLSTLDKPESISIRKDYSKVKITSDTGTVLDDNNQTNLAGNVIVNDNPDSTSATILSTEQLTIYPNRDYAETDEPVNIVSSQSILKGVGMDIDFNTRILNLHSRVEGSHDNAK
ncbi:LPS export ABC transporter periplasmic protein LptC [Neptuniibacter pectenicola]|jgi:lipopolysaccharide export system protein LptC|uniref:LPS export ABC transporter periplasmic protein LptC n=1 Tax=Neptuniibacter pectenicola TaxID=1806669 RepID=UPI003AEB20AB